jgi:hypothetical protein
LKKMAAFFRELKTNEFVGNDSARGPWSEDACHAGPPSGLVARAAESLVRDKQLVRLTLDMVRPIPLAGFTIAVKIIKQGRMLTTCAVVLSDREGKACINASSIHLKTQVTKELPNAVIARPVFEDAVAGYFPSMPVNHEKPTFAQSVEVAYPPGEGNAPGPTTIWMRTHRLIETEQPSPFQSLCPIADCGNGISRNTDLSEASFVNPDLTIAIHRAPESQWLASQATSFWQPSGLGMSHATLFDTEGPIGAAIQTLLVSAR